MMKTLTRITLLLLALLLLFSFASCDKKESEQPEKPSTDETQNDSDETQGAEISKTGAWKDAAYDRSTEFGKGETTVKVKVVAEDQSITFTLHTDKTTLGEALKEHGLIAGEEGQYGLYVKKVNGIVADYDIDQTYWSLTKSGEMMMVGVDGAEIADGEQYELTKTK